MIEAAAARLTELAAKLERDAEAGARLLLDASLAGWDAGFGLLRDRVIALLRADAAFASVARALEHLFYLHRYDETVTQRSREMGIRVALGARPVAVFRLVIGHGMVLVVVGIVLGLAGAFAATRLLTAQLFEVKPTDPAVFVAVAVALGLAGVAACVLPARRATRVDPIAALRME